MPGPCRTRRPAPGPRRSTRPRASSSRTPPTRPSLFALQKYGQIYSRIANPTVAAFEERLASLEGGLGAVATSSGQAAEFLTFACLAGAGDHIVATAGLYGGTITQLDVTLRRFGVDTDVRRRRRARPTSPRRSPPAPSWSSPRSIANPSGAVADLAGLAEVAHDAGVPLIVDATMATPYLCRPIEHGADIVIHSATKFLGGHGTTLGGVVVESGRSTGNGRFPQLTEPVAVLRRAHLVGQLQEYGFLTKLRAEQLRDIGATLSPHSAFLLLQGVETLPQRMEAHVANARRGRRVAGRRPARRLRERGRACPTIRDHDRARRYLPLGPGSVFAFGVRAAGPRASGSSSPSALQPPRQHRRRPHARHPPGVDHAPPAHRPSSSRAAGVPPDLVRISVGLEDPEDILWDLDQALAAAAKEAVSVQRPSVQGRPSPPRRAAGDPARDAHRGDRRRVAEPGARQQLRRHLPAVQQLATRCASSTRTPTEILGRPVYPSLADLPGVPDLVDVFRRTRGPPAVLDDVARRRAPRRSGSSSGSATRTRRAAARRRASRW